MQDDSQPERRHPLEEAPRRRHPLEEGAQQLAIPARPQPSGPRVRLKFAAQRPYVMWALIIINVAIFAVQYLSPHLGNQIMDAGYLRSYEALVQGQYYRLLTSMFLHAGFAHIFFNMYALYLFGRSTEMIAGHTRFTLIYFLGGLTGSLLSALAGNPSAQLGIPSVGASGAIFAVFAAEMVFLYRNREILGQRATQRLRSLVVIMLIEVGLGVASDFSPDAIKIDNWGHIGGFIGGVVLAYVIGPVLKHSDEAIVPVAEDINPLGHNLLLVSAYLVGMVIILTYASMRVG